MLKHSKKSGFTLIELSIVLVIIGLIVGGVLVGQDLIKAAEIRATVSQIEKLDAAANTFRLKYNGYPGDLANASNFLTGAISGNGNGVIANTVTSAHANGACGENVLFQSHLSLAGLDTFSPNATNLATVDDACATITSANMATVVQPAKMGKGNVIFPSSVSGTNYYALAEVASGATPGTDTAAFTDKLTPTEAYQFDSKLDDGAPATGRVMAVSDFATTNADESGSGYASGECRNGTAYFTSDATGANTNGCALRIRASF